MYADSQRRDRDGVTPAADGEHQQGREGGGHHGSEEGNDGDQAGEYAERERVRHPQQQQPDDRERAEHQHGEQLRPNPGAHGCREINQHRPANVPHLGGQQRDQAVAVGRWVAGQVQRHGDHADRLDDHRAAGPQVRQQRLANEPPGIVDQRFDQTATFGPKRGTLEQRVLLG